MGCAERYLVGYIFLPISPCVHSATLDFDKLNKSCFEKLGPVVS